MAGLGSGVFRPRIAILRIKELGSRGLIRIYIFWFRSFWL